MVYLGIFLGELVILFLLARALTMHLSIFLYKVGLGEKMVMHAVAIIFLPGTFVHEVSHYLMCIVLRVRVHGMSLLPKPMEAGYIKMGSVEHEKCDFVRSLLIGSAPFVIGNIILFTVINFTVPFGLQINWTTLAAALIVFEIGNTMFSSRADMEGAAELLVGVGIIIGIAYFLGWRISLTQLDQSIPGSLVNLLKQADVFLVIPIILDCLFSGALTILNKGD